VYSPCTQGVPKILIVSFITLTILIDPCVCSSKQLAELSRLDPRPDLLHHHNLGKAGAMRMLSWCGVSCKWRLLQACCHAWWRGWRKVCDCHTHAIAHTRGYRVHEQHIIHGVRGEFPSAVVG
jgi:hypothetical protein